MREQIIIIIIEWVKLPKTQKGVKKPGWLTKWQREKMPRCERCNACLRNDCRRGTYQQWRRHERDWCSSFFRSTHLGLWLSLASTFSFPRRRDVWFPVKRISSQREVNLNGWEDKKYGFWREKDLKDSHHESPPYFQVWTVVF